MVILSIADKEYSFPTDYNDISIRQYLQMLDYYREESIEEIIYLFLPRETVELIPAEQLNTLIELVKILFASTAYLNEKNAELATRYPRVTSLTYGQFLDWRQLIIGDPENEIVYTTTFLSCDKEYSYSDRVNNLLFEADASLGIFLQKKYADELNTLKEKYLPLFEEQDYTEEESSAGFENLKAFGSYNTVYALAGGDLLKIDQVLTMSVGAVFTFLFYQQVYNECKRNLTKEKARKKE